MDDDRINSEALDAAGYTSRRGTLFFCALLAVVGGLIGSVIIAITWNVLVPGSSDLQSTLIGASAGAVFGVLLGLLKVQRGNMEALEEVEDKAWRRQIKRELGK